MTYASPLLKKKGAFELQNDSLIDSQGVAWHYGAPLVEQRQIENGPVVVDRSHRRVLAVSGPDAPQFLNNLLSQKLDTAAPGFAAQALDMNIQGHILHTAGVALGEDGTFYLDTTHAEFASLRDYLSAMIFWSQVDITEAEVAIISLFNFPGELPEQALFKREMPANTKMGSASIEVGVPRPELEHIIELLQEKGVQLAGLMAFTAQRVRNREPELRADLDTKTIAHEVPQWIGRGEHPGAVHLNKGCYRGQETVARVENIGRSPRLLVMVHLDGSAPVMPEPGAEIKLGSRRVGRLGSVVDDCDFGPIALALIKRSAISQPLQVGDVAIRVDEDSVVKEEGTKAGRAAQEKLRGR